MSGLEKGEQGGGTETREHRSPCPTHGSLAEPTARFALCKTNEARCSCQSAASGLTPAALCAAGIGLRAAVAVEQRDNRGVSDPHLAAPFFAPRPARSGSLTPHVHVTIVRRDNTMPVTPLNAPPGSSAVLSSFASPASASVRFFRKTAFI